MLSPVFFTVQVEAGMVESMQEVCRKGLDAYSATHRASWILQWPSQVVLAVSAIFWTQEVSEAMRGEPAGGSAAAGQGGKGALAAVAAKCTNQLNEVVELVRGDLSVLNRCGLGMPAQLDPARLLHTWMVISKLALRKRADCSWA